MNPAERLAEALDPLHEDATAYRPEGVAIVAINTLTDDTSVAEMRSAVATALFRAWGGSKGDNPASAAKDARIAVNAIRDWLRGSTR